MKRPDMVYNGTSLAWNMHGTFRASSGRKGSQNAEYECVKQHGPIPHGRYTLLLNLLGTASWSRDCNFRRSPRGIQSLHNVPLTKRCTRSERDYLVGAWGDNRVRLDPADKETRRACAPRRSNFYIHDSRKGYSQGCIEVHWRFFDRLYKEAERRPGKKLLLHVEYPPGASTFGGTNMGPDWYGRPIEEDL